MHEKVFPSIAAKNTNQGECFKDKEIILQPAIRVVSKKNALVMIPGRFDHCSMINIRKCCSDCLSFLVESIKPVLPTLFASPAISLAITAISTTTTTTVYILQLFH